ncbi:MAG TPA: NAD(P)/FAD-dependent oxidoreductase [Thermoanaerobaculia bacterium]|jgi:flavin-dependent dehydrogenase|nr:NAD(P)/FAD-dependent oxidoreductase [Thermoanaerobaculia bacterium]
MVRIAILGGGPAGGSAALALARSGVTVDLYLPARPGEKPCGGALPEHVLPRLAGFDPSSLPAVAEPAALLENAAGSSVAIALRGLRIFRRGDFDRALVEAAVAAGARRLPVRAERLELMNGEARVTAGGEVRAYDWVIGADGARGLSRRSLGLVPEGDSLGLGGSLRGLVMDRLVLSFPDLADSYLWIFPRPGGVSVGIAYTPDRLSEGAARAALDGFLDRHLPAGWRDLPGPRYRYPIPVFGAWTLRSVRHGLDRRVLLTGDAAALADPLTREGIRYGLLSGLWAAESLLAGQPEGYAGRLGRELAADLSRAERARELFFDDPVGQWMVPVARRHPGIRRVLADLLACRQPYQGLKRRLLRAAFYSRPVA